MIEKSLKSYCFICLFLIFLSGCRHGEKKENFLIRPTTTKIEVEHSPTGSAGDKPANSYYHYMEAELHKNTGKTEDYADQLRKALENDPSSIFLRMETAFNHIEKKEFDSALEHIRAALKIDPEHPDALIMEGRLLQEQNRMDLAAESYRKLIEAAPSRKKAYLLLGEILFEHEKWDEAQDVYRLLVDRFPEFYAGHFYLGRVHRQKGDTSAAEAAFLKTLELNPEVNEPRYELAGIYESLGMEKKLLLIYEELYEKDPADIRAAMGLALCLNQTGQREKAAEMLADLGERSRFEDAVIHTLYQNYVETKRYEDAVVILKGMLEGDSENSSLNYFAGFCLMELKRKDEAIRHFEQVKPDFQFYKNAIVHIAFIHQEAGRTADAARFLEVQFKKNPSSELTIYLGAFYEEMADYQAAERILRKGVEMDPENGNIHYRLGILLDKTDRKDAAVEAVKKAVLLDPENAGALNFLGYTYAEKGILLDEAEVLIKEALKIRPNDGYITDSLGWVFFRKGMFPEAVKILEEAVGLVPDDPIILEHLGDAYLKTDRKEKALEAYRRSLLKREKDKETIQEKIRALEGNGS